MPALAITDFHNMFGVFKFINAVLNHEINQGDSHKLKPIVGCELSICKDHADKSNRDFGVSQVFLCKNKNGYFNLSKLSLRSSKSFDSIGYNPLKTIGLIGLYPSKGLSEGLDLVVIVSPTFIFETSLILNIM